MMHRSCSAFCSLQISIYICFFAVGYLLLGSIFGSLPIYSMLSLGQRFSVWNDYVKFCAPIVPTCIKLLVTLLIEVNRRLFKYVGGDICVLNSMTEKKYTLSILMGYGRYGAYKPTRMEANNPFAQKSTIRCLLLHGWNFLHNILNRDCNV